MERDLVSDGARRRRFRGRILLAAAIYVGAWLCWAAVPELCASALENGLLMDSGDAESAVQHTLAACGPTGIAAILRRSGTMGKSKSSVELIGAAALTGEPGRKALVRAIDRETLPGRKVSEVLLLIWAFGDYSRVNVWIQESARRRGGFASTLRGELAVKCRDGTVPEVRLEDDRLNPDFVRWYRRNAPSHGLPPLPSAPGQ